MHLELESTARTIRTYEAQFVPGLWQTEDYARAVIDVNDVTRQKEIVDKGDNSAICCADRLADDPSAAPPIWKSRTRARALLPSSET